MCQSAHFTSKHMTDLSVWQADNHGLPVQSIYLWTQTWKFLNNRANSHTWSRQTLNKTLIIMSIDYNRSLNHTAMWRVQPLFTSKHSYLWVAFLLQFLGAICTTPTHLDNTVTLFPHETAATLLYHCQINARTDLPRLIELILSQSRDRFRRRQKAPKPFLLQLEADGYVFKNIL